MANVFVKPFDNTADFCIHVHKDDVVVCHLCEKPASKQCDFMRDDERCNATLCLNCRVNISERIDHCPNHENTNQE